MAPSPESDRIKHVLGSKGDGRILKSFLLVTYILDDPAGPEAVVEAHPATVLVVFPGADDILVACVVVALVQNPPASFHLDRVAPANEAVQVDRVAFAVVGLPLEVPVLEEQNLWKRSWDTIIDS